MKIEILTCCLLIESQGALHLYTDSLSSSQGVNLTPEYVIGMTMLKVRGDFPKGSVKDFVVHSHSIDSSKSIVEDKA